VRTHQIRWLAQGHLGGRGGGRSSRDKTVTFICVTSPPQAVSFVSGLRRPGLVEYVEEPLQDPRLIPDLHRRCGWG
jgi:hypothetical protein